MKKVAVLSYFYPPCNLTAAHRVGAFAVFLTKHQIYPIVITRNWEHEIQDESDLAAPSGSEIIHQKNLDHEVYYLPFGGSKRDKLLVKYGEHRRVLLRKIYTFRELLLQTVGIMPEYRRSIYKKLEELIEKEGIEVLLISANPFWQYYFGYRIKKKYPKVKWIADYRDDWTTGKLGKGSGIGHHLIHFFENKNEKKWVGSSSLIISVTKVLSERIGKFVGKPYTTIANGFTTANEINLQLKPAVNCFTISYTGYLYEEQQVELFLKAFKRIVVMYSSRIKLRVRFIGTAFNHRSAYRVLEAMKGFEEHLMITKRISRTECFEMEQQSDVFLMLAYENLKGIPGSKLYQYLPHLKPILLCPSDGDIVEEILLETGLGIICNNEEETVNELKVLIEKKLKGQELINSKEVKGVEFYSRQNQVRLLAEQIHSL